MRLPVINKPSALRATPFDLRRSQKGRGKIHCGTTIFVANTAGKFWLSFFEKGDNALPELPHSEQGNFIRNKK
jgi:hypothetical protein